MLNGTSKMKRETLNEEQLALGAKEAGTLQRPLFLATARLPRNPVKSTSKMKIEVISGKKIKQEFYILQSITIEADRFFDARAFAMRHFGVSEVETKLVKRDGGPVLLFPRWQVRWDGNACNGNTLKMQARQVTSIEDIAGDETRVPWLDVRDI